MLEVIDTLPRFEGGKFLFSSQNGVRPIKAEYFSAPKIKLDGLMQQILGNKLPDWTNHDIRRTVRTKLSALRIPEEVREAVLAHARPGIKGHYDYHRYLDEKRDALTQWAARLRSIVAPDSKVVEFTKARR